MSDIEYCALLNIIKRYPEGIKEYDLLKLLQKQQSKDLQVGMFDTLALFKQHFILFHALYKINEKLYTEQSGQLVISVLNIQWLAIDVVKQDRKHLSTANPLREYYLDIKNLENTSKEDVDNLLTSFWRYMNNDSEKQSALTCLGLDEPCDLITIKKRYKKLLSAHHPDKGGCVVTAQSLNEAMVVLKRCFVG